jgi:ABC-2 type transport system permease protein
MLPLLRSEIFRLSRRAMPRILVGLLALIMFALYLLFWTLIRAAPQDVEGVDTERFRDSLSFAAVRETGTSLTQSVGTVMAVILGATIISSEFGWGTIRTLLPRASGRAPFITAKLIALTSFVLLLAIVGFVVAVVGSTIVTLLENLGGSLADALDGASLAAVGRTTYVMLPYAALAFMIAVWTRSTAAGIGIGLAVLFLEGLIVNLISAVGGPLEHLPAALLSQNVASLINANSRGAGTGLSGTPQNLPDPWQAAGVLAAYTAVFVALSYWRFSARDITAN